ncbi:MAG: helix-turn-helix domain-containing protein [Gammaproteobacteria bacterium]|jgi:IclR family pca regulon transcriptional regulator|nr:helix-turn-helix domain-containing protein [Gammaproteobacteria bacterium]MBT6041947.1 helix-turn-helix domain-containing protein [Gammaproteobacteria bacterium]
MVEKNPRSDGEYLNSLARGLAVLRAFSREKPEMTLSELAVQTDLNPAVVRRCLITLQHLGYVGKKDKLFLLRPEVFSLGAAYIESMNLEEVVRPSLQRIRDKTDNSVALAVLSDLDVLFLVYVSTKQLTRIVAGVGTRFPAYATSAGRVLLAYADKGTVDDYFSKVHMEALTEKTVATKKEMKSILSNVKKNRYSSTEGELDFGVVSVAVPVFNEEQKIIASISCSTASARTTEQKMIEEIVPELQEAAREIEFELRRCPMLAHSIIS